MANRAVFLDRDGVLVRAKVNGNYAHGPLTLEDFELLPDIAGPVRRIREAGFLVILATNQPGIARGYLDWETLNEMHRRLREVVTLDAVEVCPHTDADGCACRKPKGGMLLAAAGRFSIELAASYFVGDTERDVRAAEAAGATPVLIDAPYNRQLSVPCRAPNLAAAADWILSGGSRGPCAPASSGTSA